MVFDLLWCRLAFQGSMRSALYALVADGSIGLNDHALYAGGVGYRL